jgi:DNA-binding transcriptional MerR regulator
MSQADTFSIRQMVELTGLSEFTIRGWENRYEAFAPRRGETGRRKYRKCDVERALLLRELLKRGHKIGKIAALNSQKLKELFEETGKEQQAQLVEKKSEVVNQAIELMALQKWGDLDILIKKNRVRDIYRFISEFCLPLLQALSANINSGLVSISQEHIFSTFLKEKIYSELNQLNARQDGRLDGRVDDRKKLKRIGDNLRFVLAAPEGDHHETGLLLAHLLIRSHGFVSLYLGAHTPARDLSETALRFNASHLLIVATASQKSGARQEPLAYVSDVQKKVGAQLEILLAGSQAPIAFKSKPTLTILHDFPSLEDLLQRVESHEGSKLHGSFHLSL